ncbi:MAG TPA: D-glycero-beta-D-manno-heptose-7-phosphate kinase [Thermodesulfatator sp.]|nr:D-glycero-beta-D-manno-heptose-7-phosphate kinase [Thermodesulfatator sp.]
MIQELLEALDKLCGQVVAVVGDLMVDHFIWGDVSRISPEAPVPVVEVHRESLRLGGAANVADNLFCLGLRPLLCGLLGPDASGQWLREELRRRGLPDQGLIPDDRPTTVKTRVVAQGQHVVRFDKERRDPAPLKAVKSILRIIEESLEAIRLIIVSDYAKGTVTAPLMEGLKNLAKSRDIPLLVDPKVDNADLYRGAWLITPNRAEAEALTGHRIRHRQDLVAVVERLRGRLNIPVVLVTLGAEGMALFEGDRPPFFIPALAREIYDVTGAGDTVMAALAAGLTAGLSLPQAAVLANHAAAVVVGKIGTAAITKEELRQQLAEGRSC